MRISSFIGVVAMAGLLSACATKPSQPDWVAGDSAKYPGAQYLTGRGIASSQDDAKDRARADLAKVFQVAVVSDSEDVQTYKSDSAGGAGQYEGQASRRITTRTDQIVRGIQIAELWQDPVTHNHYALAVLPRLQAAASLRQQVNQLDDGVRANIEQSRSNADLFLKIAAANRALDQQRERDALQKSLQVVDVTGRGVESQLSVSKLKADLDSLLKRVHVATQVADNSPAGLANIVAGAVSQAGYLIDTGDRPDFVLKARMDLVDMGQISGWYWQRGTLEITLVEAANGRVRGTKRWPIKASAVDKETAVKRTLDQADAVLKSELGNSLIEMATNR